MNDSAFSSLSAPEVEQQQLLTYLTQAGNCPEFILCTATTDSTNDDVLQLYHQGIRSALVITQRQQRGRGQHQRTWVSQQGNIFLSTLVELSRPVDGRFALECGLNLIHCPTLQHMPDLQLKWANDLYSPHGKWGGILIEPITPQQIIVGIGINVVPVAKHDDIQQAVTSLHSLGLIQYQRAKFLAEIYLAIMQSVSWFNFGSQNLAARFNAVAAFKDQPVKLERPTAEITGIFRGIQDDGALLIESYQLSESKISAYYDGRLTRSL